MKSCLIEIVVIETVVTQREKKKGIIIGMRHGAQFQMK